MARLLLVLVLCTAAGRRTALVRRRTALQFLRCLYSNVKARTAPDHLPALFCPRLARATSGGWLLCTAPRRAASRWCTACSTGSWRCWACRTRVGVGKGGLGVLASDKVECGMWDGGRTAWLCWVHVLALHSCRKPS